jgi:hypothetical protein
MALVLVLVLAGCSQLAMAPEEDWTRSWARPFDTVWTTALELLEDEGFVVERINRDAGTIRAEAPDGHELRRQVLHLTIAAREGATRVEIGVSGPSGGPGELMRFDQTAASFLDELDRALRETG